MFCSDRTNLCFSCYLWPHRGAYWPMIYTWFIHSLKIKSTGQTSNRISSAQFEVQSPCVIHISCHAWVCTYCNTRENARRDAAHGWWSLAHKNFVVSGDNRSFLQQQFTCALSSPTTGLAKLKANQTHLLLTCLFHRRGKVFLLLKERPEVLPTEERSLKKQTQNATDSAF